MSNYDPAPFYGRTFAQPSGTIFWSFLNQSEALRKMVEASHQDQPAVASVSRDLLSLVGEEGRASVFTDNCKQMIGAMVKQVLQTHGYEVAAKNVSIPNDELFTKGTVYSATKGVQG